MLKLILSRGFNAKITEIQSERVKKNEKEGARSKSRIPIMWGALLDVCFASFTLYHPIKYPALYTQITDGA